MRSNFFPKKEDNLSTEDNLKRFLENFPEQEFWRFFVERDRYDYRQELYWLLAQKLNNISKEEAKKIAIADIELSLKNFTVGDLYAFAKSNNDRQTLYGLDNRFHAADKKHVKLCDMINKHQGWVGFEDNEPGYLSHVTKGFNFILENIVNHNHFNLDFIKNLHKICTQDVKKMISQTPGEFRTGGAAWEMSSDFDSLAGLTESIQYLQHLQDELGMSGVLISIDPKKGLKTAIKTENFKYEAADLLAKRIWEAFEEGATISFIASEPPTINSKDFLEKISNRHIDELELNLKNAETKEEKLTAIFTYLKHTVLHHPFQDGVGRTYSMLLIQYLLMRENLLPVLIKNSNIIPGYSVKELVNEYFRAEKEMEAILKKPTHVTSREIADPNIDTSTLLATLSQPDQVLFNACLLDYQNTKAFCLSSEKKIAPQTL